MRVYSGSDIGLVRDSNQDYCKTGMFSDNAVWAVVCDGMGGANGGCTASSVATEAISQHLTEGYHPDMTSEQLRELREATRKDLPTIKTIVADIVPTYTPQTITPKHEKEL